MARTTYTLCGFILGACFPLCALMFAHMASPTAGSADFISFAWEAHLAHPVYYALDVVPLGLGAIGFLLGGIFDRATSDAIRLRRKVTAQTKKLIKIAEALDDRKKWDQQRVKEAFYDPITQVANRALFTNRAEHALVRAGSKRKEIAVLFLDLDDFRTINDMLGHNLGNRVLYEVAQRFARRLRTGDTLARLVADEFALLLDRMTTEEDAVATAQKLIDSLADPIQIGARQVKVGVSVGVVSGSRNATVDTLLRDASLAMNEAKERGKNCLRVYRDDMHSALLERVSLAGDLQRALANEEFFLMYQPIVDLQNDRIVGMEALVRWQHPKRGLIQPNAFIKLAEDSNAIVPLGEWVLRTACGQMAQWQAGRTSDSPLTLTVNVSPVQLHSGGFADRVRAVVTETGVLVDGLVLEITETGLVENTAENLALFNALKSIGLRLAIDDFGTGYSTLSYLQRFPFDVLKIDKSFIDGVANGGTDAAFARTIISLGGLLKMRVLAEGIEHANQRSMLRELGCGYGQGYLFDKPLDAATMTARLDAGGIIKASAAQPAVAVAAEPVGAAAS